MEKKREGNKRELDQTPSTSAENELLMTPTKQLRSDGHQTTPLKKRLDFDFWAKKEQPKEELSPQYVDIVNVGVGQTQPIQFRVTLVEKLKKVKGDLSILNFHGLDNTGEISVTAFGKVADRIESTITINKCYTLSNYSVKEESQNYRSGTGHKYQINLNAKTTIVEIENNDFLPEIPFNFVTLESIQIQEACTKADVLGIVVVNWGTAETSSGKLKRDLNLTDENKANLMITLFGKEAELFGDQVNVVLAIRKGTVGEYDSRKSLNCYSDASVWVNPTGSPIEKQSVELKDWFDKELDQQL